MHMQAKEKGKAVVRADDEPELQFTDADGPTPNHRDWADFYEVRHQTECSSWQVLSWAPTSGTLGCQWHCLLSK